ncbi:MAG: hypothetical protein JWN79_3520 [Gemmatimonadetes bacterium]|jgi:uncharacterized protein (DUF488 family)|nr:hypothetical protein [Gemmatimonadota bacterium]
MSDTLCLWTVGHSTRPFDDFALTLQDPGIELVVDVRRLPGSRRLPQYDAATLEDALGHRGVAYRWIAQLGGRRRPDPESVNTGWTHRSFRAYADHVYTDEFAEGLGELLMLAGGLRTAIMCAEVLWWRCHRRLIADVLVSIGVPVVHLFAPGKREAHVLAPPASIVRGRLSYR